MMKIETINRGTEGELRIIGRLDTDSATEGEKALLDAAERFNSLVINMAQLEYLSSAGLRVLKRAHVAMRRKGGSLAVKNVSKTVMEILDITGFSEMLTFV